MRYSLFTMGTCAYAQVSFKFDVNDLKSKLFLRSRRGRSLHYLLLIVPLHHGVTRLITITLAVKRLLLLHSGIPIS